MLANQIFLMNTRYSQPDDRHMFVVIADQVFEECEHLSPQSFQELIASATQAASLCVEHGWTNCGAYYELPWVNTLLKNAKRLGSRFPWSFVSSLLTSLEKNMKEGLLLGNGNLPGLEQLQDLRRKFYPPRTEPAFVPPTIHSRPSSRRSSDPESLKWQPSIQNLKSFPQPFAHIVTPVAGTSNSPGTIFHARSRVPSLRRPTSIPSFNTPTNLMYDSPASAHYRPLLANPPINLLRVHVSTLFTPHDNSTVITGPSPPPLISETLSDAPSHTPLPTPLPTPGGTHEDLPPDVIPSDKMFLPGPSGNES